MKIALCHLDLSMGPQEKNIEKLCRAVEMAGERGAEWTITPETAVQKRLQEPGLRLRMTAAAKDKLLTVGMDIRYGARPLRRALQKEVEDKLADLYLEGTFSRGEEILVDVINGEFAFTRIKEEPTGTLVPVEEERSHG